VEPELVITKGLHIAGTHLNLDEPGHVRASLITNSCVKGLRKKAKAIMTPRLMEVTGRPKFLQIMPLNFGKTMGLGKIKLSLYPSGLSKGAGIAIIETAESRYLYVSLSGLDQHRVSAEMPRVPKADTLIVRHAGVDFREKNLSAVQAVNGLLPLIGQSLSQNNCALLLPDLLPDAVELALALKGAGLRVLLHTSVLQFARKVGVLGFNAVRVAPGKRTRASVVIWPYSLANSPVLGNYHGPRFCQPGDNGDIEVPFSGKIDPWRLMKLARASHAKQVLVVGKLAKKSETMLERAGILFSVFWNPDQLKLF